MPAASVGVATMHPRRPFLKHVSTSFLWGLVRPAWWNAHPFLMALPSLVPMFVGSSCSPASLFEALARSSALSLTSPLTVDPSDRASDSQDFLELTNTRVCPPPSMVIRTRSLTGSSSPSSFLLVLSVKKTSPPWHTPSLSGTGLQSLWTSLAPSHAASSAELLIVAESAIDLGVGIESPELDEYDLERGPAVGVVDEMHLVRDHD